MSCTKIPCNLQCLPMIVKYIELICSTQKLLPKFTQNTCFFKNFVIYLVVMEDIMEVLPKLFTKETIIQNFQDEKQYFNWLMNKLNAGKIKKIRNNLYALVDITTNDIYASKFEIASKITSSSYLCFHSALEYYGIQNQVFSNIYVGSKTRFNNFVYGDIEYIYTNMIKSNFINYIANEEIRVTSREKTIVDCIDNINLAGGIEEVLYALDQTKYLVEKKLLEILKEYNKKFLYQKVGYLLELFNSQLQLSEDFYNECMKNIGKKINYFLKDEFKDLQLNNKWNLIVPINIKSRINGGY